MQVKKVEPSTSVFSLNIDESNANRCISRTKEKRPLWTSAYKSINKSPSFVLSNILHTLSDIFYASSIVIIVSSKTDVQKTQITIVSGKICHKDVVSDTSLDQFIYAFIVNFIVYNSNHLILCLLFYLQNHMLYIPNKNMTKIIKLMQIK